MPEVLDMEMSVCLNISSLQMKQFKQPKRCSWNLLQTLKDSKGSPLKSLLIPWLFFFSSATMIVSLLLLKQLNDCLPCHMQTFTVPLRKNCNNFGHPLSEHADISIQLEAPLCPSRDSQGHLISGGCMQEWYKLVYLKKNKGGKMNIFKLDEPHTTEKCRLIWCETSPNYMVGSNDRSTDGTMVSRQRDVHKTFTFCQIQLSFTCCLAETIADWERRERLELHVISLFSGIVLVQIRASINRPNQ